MKMDGSLVFLLITAHPILVLLDGLRAEKLRACVVSVPLVIAVRSKQKTAAADQIRAFSLTSAGARPSASTAIGAITPAQVGRSSAQEFRARSCCSSRRPLIAHGLP